MLTTGGQRLPSTSKGLVQDGAKPAPSSTENENGETPRDRPADESVDLLPTHPEVKRLSSSMECPAQEGEKTATSSSEDTIGVTPPENPPSGRVDIPPPAPETGEGEKTATPSSEDTIGVTPPENPPGGRVDIPPPAPETGRLSSSNESPVQEGEKTATSSSEDTIGVTPPENPPSGRVDIPPPAPERGGEDDGNDMLVPEHGIKPGMQAKWFRSGRHGFRLGVQKDSVPVHPSDATSGPIKVSQLTDSIRFEGDQWQGVLKVECLPSGRRFGAPLLFDFPVDAGNKNAPIMDFLGRIRYEVLIMTNGHWTRDPEGSIPLRVVKDDEGQTYVRAQIRHFCIWGLWTPTLNRGVQAFRRTKLSFSHRSRHQSAVKNITDGDIAIHIYVMRMSQWKTSIKSVSGGGGAAGFNAQFAIDMDVRKHANLVSKMPQMVTIPSGGGHIIEIPRVGASIFSGRQAAVVIATLEEEEGGGKRMRMEAVINLRSGMLLEIDLPVNKDGKLVGSPAAAESGGILSQVYRVMQNYENASFRPPSSTVTRSRSGAQSAANGSTSARVASAAAGLPGQHPADGWLVGSPVMSESKDDEGYPCTAEAAGAASAASAASAAGAADGAAGTPAGPAPAI